MSSSHHTTTKQKPKKISKPSRKLHEDLRVQVLRKTIPKSYFRHRASMVKIIYTRSMTLIDRLKRCQEMVAPNKKRKIEETTPKKNLNENSCGKVAMNILKKFTGNGMKKIENGREKATKLIYF